MPIEQLPFAEGEAGGLEQLAGAPPLMVNTLVDLANTRRARPGIAAWSSFPTPPTTSPVDGMTIWGSYVVYVTRDRRLWAWTADGSVMALSDGSLPTMLEGADRPQLLALRDKVVAVGGGAPQEWLGLGTGLSQRLGVATPGYTPPSMNTIVGIDTRLVSGYRDPSGIFRWSGLGNLGHQVWDALNFAEAEARPDPIVAIAENTNELFVFGTETLQVFSPDPVVGFAPGRTMNLGLLAPYSLIKVDDMFAFLDREKRFVLTEGRSFTDEQSVLSKQIEARLRTMTPDCWGFRMRNDRWDACVWMFPTDGIGYIWNRRNRTWSEWRAYAAGGYTAPTMTSAVYWPERNLFLVGLSNGQIAKLDSAAYTDLGGLIKVEIVSGFVDHGTQNRKKCRAVKFQFKRGQAVPPLDPRVEISYRDDLGAFGQSSIYSLGQQGDYDPTIEMRSEGIYRQRQWRLQYTSAAEFSFIGAREEFDVLHN